MPLVLLEGLHRSLYVEQSGANTFARVPGVEGSEPGVLPEDFDGDEGRERTIRRPTVVAELGTASLSVPSPQT